MIKCIRLKAFQILVHKSRWQNINNSSTEITTVYCIFRIFEFTLSCNDEYELICLNTP